MPNVILWLEDRPESVVELLVFCEENGLEVELVPTALAMHDVLQERAEEIGVIVVDIMLYQVMNLEDIGLTDSPTDGGYDAGWVVIERFLRPDPNARTESEARPELSAAPYAAIPVLIVSSRPLGREEKARLSDLRERARVRGNPPIEYLEKGGITQDRKQPWDKEFQRIIMEVLLS